MGEEYLLLLALEYECKDYSFIESRGRFPEQVIEKKFEKDHSPALFWVLRTILNPVFAQQVDSKKSQIIC